ncbi:ABC transporter permease [Alkaliphilus peptidifermentans]|uniref:Transport permease protein n=1 Tax=Alkaliphilus peptidifermentans DSM 18978 TaxID=1120976 RepID=A0A1G5K767_9FIRM|nr:ABC transporter permease [Alkaliphilus peptidifermentans]SCY96314.1 ABC-2 type transport system permease protein [Alkaliphilus peptidifermentans DSM 18978]
MMERTNNFLVWLKGVWNFILMDLLEFLRSPAQIIGTLMAPIIMITSFGIGTSIPTSVGMNPGLNVNSYFEFVAPGIMLIGIMFGTTMGIGNSILLDKRKRITEDVITSSMPYSAFIISRYLSMLLKSLLQFLVILITAMLFFKLRVENIAMLLVAASAAVIFFTGVGVWLAAFTDEITFAGLSNLLLIPLFYFSGIFFPIENFGALGNVVQYLPSSMQLSILRYSIIGIRPDNLLLVFTLTILLSILMIVLPGHALKSSIKK